MSRDFITAVMSRAMHEEIFRQLLQYDAEAAADAMEMTYEPADLREVQAIHEEIAGLDSDTAREKLEGILQQAQDFYGSPQRPKE